MLIKRFYLPFAEVTSLGLHEVNMPRLGRYIAIAGKNGAGKSRLLTLLEQRVAARSQALTNLPNFRETIKNHENAIINNPGNLAIPGWQNTIDQAKQQIANCLERVIADENSKFKALRFVPKGLNLEDPRQQNPHTLTSRSAAASSTHIENYQTHCLHYIQKLQNRWWSVSHQNYSGDKSEHIGDYERLNDLIVALLGISLGRNADDEATIFQKPLADAGLSDGQKVILQLAVALHAQKGTLDNTVFILDELENHLHPSAAIDLLKKLDDAAPNAQVWIATHSVPLLAYVASLEPMAIWYMEDGAITHSGRRPERVLKGLLGDEERIGQVHFFTGLPALLAATNYAVESLLPPKTANGEERDPQVGQISKILRKMEGTQALSVLDFGAGKGRLLEGIAAERSLEELASKINYFAFDVFPADKDACCAVIGEHFGSSDGRYFGSPDEFFSQKDDKTIDVVVMCNVLHEIPPSQWLSLFSETSLIMRALKDTGFLLLVEDQRIPVGEKAHEHGFLVLDTPQLKTLFDIREDDIARELFAHDDCRNDGRLKAHLISNSLLRRLSTETRGLAISQLLASALEHIRDVRRENPSYTNGQLHGFWTQQLANAYMHAMENGQTPA